MKRYYGTVLLSGDSIVTVTEDVKERRLDPPKELPAFYWGRTGDGSWQLALALLADALGDTYPPRNVTASISWRLHMQFERDFVARWRPYLPFEITDTEILAWVRQQEAKQSHTSDVGGSESARQRSLATSSNSPAGGTGKSTAVEAEGGRKEARH